MARSTAPGAGSVDPADHPALTLPDEDWQWFLARARALELPTDELPRAVIEALYGHLLGVNEWLNLTRLTSPRDYLKQHLLDSLALRRVLRPATLSVRRPCLDLGSGGGYPGLPLALVYRGVPWLLVDSRRRKAEFLAAACRLLPEGCRAEARAMRAREAARIEPSLRRSCQMVVSRAAGGAEFLLEESAELLARGGRLVIYKGPAYDQIEADAALAAARRSGYALEGIHRLRLDEGDNERILVIFERVR